MNNDSTQEPPLDPNTTESPESSEVKDSKAVLDQTLRHLDEYPEFEWIRQNPLAARAYIIGVWMGFAEMSPSPNPNTMPFRFCQHPALVENCFQQTRVGKIWRTITDDRADDVASGEALHELRCIIEQKVEMMEHVRHLLDDMASDLIAEGFLLRQLKEAGSNLEKIHKSSEFAPDKQEIVKLQDLEHKLGEFEKKQQRLREFLSQIARMDADHMFPRQSI
jgi:hypothetical protein